MSEVRIRAFQAGDEETFRILNEEWIERYFRIEEPDRKTLNNPRGSILDRGGAIFIAEEDGRAVGCCALIPNEPGVLELAKMAVTESSQGRGIGAGLMAAAVEAARAMGAARLMLETNSTMGPAIRLYARSGFV